jgi:hypothetical protein
MPVPITGNGRLRLTMILNLPTIKDYHSNCVVLQYHHIMIFWPSFQQSIFQRNLNSLMISSGLKVIELTALEIIYYCDICTVKLGYKELGYNEHPVITNKMKSNGCFQSL